MMSNEFIRANISDEKYRCWICLDDELNSKDRKFNWFEHQCGCKLQIHKKCYLGIVYSGMEKHYYYYLFLRDIQHTDQSWSEIKANRLRHFIKCSGSRIPSQIRSLEKSFLLSILSPLNKTLISFFDFNSFGFLFKYLSDRNKLNVIMEEDATTPGSINFTIDIPTCPQCHKAILSSSRRDFNVESFFLKVYQALLDLNETTIIAICTAMIALNPPISFLNLALWQLRCIFPESQLRYILNIDTTKAIDVYLSSTKTFHNLSADTLCTISFWPLHLGFFIARQGILTDSQLVIPSLQWFDIVYRRIVFYRNLDFNVSLLSKCLGIAEICLLGYGLFLNPILDIILPLPTSDPSGKVDTDQKILDRLVSYFYRTPRKEVRPLHLIIMKIILWPFSGKLIGTLLNKFYILFKRLRRLSDNQIFPNFRASNDEFKMIFNFIGCGIVGLSSSIIERVVSIKQIEKDEKLEKLVQTVIEEQD